MIDDEINEYNKQMQKKNKKNAQFATVNCKNDNENLINELTKIVGDI